MVMLNNLRPDLPPEAFQDCFRPPTEPVEVRCRHCGRQYSSELIIWTPTDDACTGFWRCPHADCDGAGFQFDIFPLDEDGWLICEEDGDPCEACDDADCEHCDLFENFENAEGFESFEGFDGEDDGLFDDSLDVDDAWDDDWPL